jgi:signal transduction histidine kinase
VSDLVSAHLLQAQDEERRRISRQLRDSVGQSLTIVSMNLEMLSRTVSDRTLAQTIDLVKEISREVRIVSYLMLLCGLVTAINWCAEEFSERRGIGTQVIAPEELPRLPIEAETALYRIVQECLTNVHRYSGASKVWIRIAADDGQLRMEVEDNGKGFLSRDAHAGPGARVSLGVGIAGMRELMRELSGSLRIASSKHGTTVTAVLPLTGMKEARSRPGKVGLRAV